MPRYAPKSGAMQPASGMDDFGGFDVPSPSGSLYYVYGDADQYLESHTSESQSPSGSLYDLGPGAEYGAMSHVYPSPERDDEEASQPSQQKPAAAKRKRENRYKNAPPSVLSRRRAQNRASQRAYRERKDQRIKDLEHMLNEAKQRNDVLGQAYAALQAEYVALKTAQLKEQQQRGYQPDLAYPGVAPAGALAPPGDGLDYSEFVYSDMQTGYAL